MSSNLLDIIANVMERQVIVLKINRDYRPIRP